MAAKTEQIVRVSKDREHPYTVISNALLQNESLTWEARGMMAYLLSKPDNWQVRMQDLIKSGKKCGRQATQTIIKELMAAGYIERRLERGAQGRFCYVTIVYESPNTERIQEQPTVDAQADDSTADDGSTVNGSPVNGEPGHIENTELPSTEERSDTNVSHARGAERAPVSDSNKSLSPEQRQRNAMKKAVREHFELRTNLKIPSKGNSKGVATQWWNPIREICELADYDLDGAKKLVDDSLKRLDGLTVADPNSILKTARAIVAEGKKGPKRARRANPKQSLPVAAQSNTRWG